MNTLRLSICRDTRDLKVDDIVYCFDVGFTQIVSLYSSKPNYPVLALTAENNFPCHINYIYTIDKSFLPRSFRRDIEDVVNRRGKNKNFRDVIDTHFYFDERQITLIRK
jgi:hypothetical protein